jgi:hypothetical protein
MNQFFSIPCALSGEKNMRERISFNRFKLRSLTEEKVREK